MADFPLRWAERSGCGPASHRRNRRASTVRPARRAPRVKVYLFTYVYVVAVNKGGPTLCKTSVYADGSTPCRMHNRMRTVCGEPGFQG